MTDQVTLTLSAIRAHWPCKSGWEKLLSYLGKTTTDDEPLSLLTVLESNGVEDAIWCLRALGPEHHKFIVSFACDCAERALKYIPDVEDRPRRAIAVTRAWLGGEATIEEVKKAAARAVDVEWVAWVATAAWLLPALATAAVARAAAKECQGQAERQWQAERLRQLLTSKGEQK